MIRIKRTYDPPTRGDGLRILVERLWPRGITKEALAADAWMKEVAPSTELRRWFGHRVERWEEFRRRYREELSRNPAAWEPILEAERRGTVTLLYSAHDVAHKMPTCGDTCKGHCCREGKRGAGYDRALIFANQEDKRK